MSNNPIKLNNMQELAAYQRYLREHPKLRHLFFELTDQCNLHCLHCGSSCESANSTFLPCAEIEKVLSEVSAAYTPGEIMVCLTGGEPLLHPDLYRVIHTARFLGFPVGITTNGTLIDDAAAGKLAAAGLSTISVSIDGVGAVHDRLRQTAGSFDAAMRGVHALRRYGIEAQAMTVVHKGNLDHLNTLYDFLRADGFYSWRLTNVDPIGRASQSSGLLLDADGLKRLLDLIRQYRFDPENEMEVTYGCAHFLNLDYENEVRDFYFQCGAGTLVGNVMANGNIGACLDIERRPELVQGNIYRDSFTDVWKNRFRFFREDRTGKSEVCRECEHRTICMGDSAHTWDYDRQEPLYCVAKMLERST